MFNHIKSFTQSLIHGRNGFSPSMTKILTIVGHEIILRMEIQRNPLNALLQGTLNVLTNNPYDKLFHLKIVIQTDHHVVSLEKEEVIVMKMNPHQHPQAERLAVPVPYNMTIDQLLENTKQKMGDDFFKYDASHNNCQDFIKSILEANNLATHENLNFVCQNTAQLFDNRSSIRKFSNTVTDLAGRFNVIREGGSLSQANGLSSDDIELMLKSSKTFNGVYCKDELPKTLKRGWYVVNMQNSRDGDGTHWVCFKTGKPLIYFDSFGVGPPIEVLRKSTRDVIFNCEQIQDLGSTACGWFCVACILSDKDVLPNEHHFRRFLTKFSKKTKMNDILLAKVLKEEGILS